MDKRLHPPFSQRKAISEFLRTSAIIVKFYNPILLNRFQPENEKILRKNQNHFRRNLSTTSQILAICWIIEVVRSKYLELTLLFVDFSKAFDSIHRGNMEQILLIYWVLKETVTAIMMLYKNTKTMVRSTDWWHRLLHRCVWSLARRFIRAIYIFKLSILCTSNVHKFNKKCFT